MHPDYATAAPFEDRPSNAAPVHEAHARCQREAEGLEKSLMVLGERLTAVIAPSTPQKDPGETVRAMPEDGGVPLAHDLHSHADTLALLRRRVESMTQRLGV